MLLGNSKIEINAQEYKHDVTRNCGLGMAAAFPAIVRMRMTDKPAVE